MEGKRVVVIDGTPSGDQDLLPLLEILKQVLGADRARVTHFPLREMKVAHCLGCFDCWIKTPGLCKEADDGREIAKAVVRSDATVFFTPVAFGGYSPELKKVFERCIPLISPFFQMEHGEVHHPPRYERRPRLMMVGVQRQANPEEAQIFRTLAGRNAINFHPPSYAAEVVVATDERDVLRARFGELMTRDDSLPFGEAAASLMPAPVIAGAPTEADSDKRALLIVGSPKINEPSTSSAIGGYLLERLSKHGWETGSLTLRASLNRREGEGELLAAVERAGLIIFAFPLYADALPYLVTKALTVIEERRRNGHSAARQRVMAIVNSGFPETHQNAVAMAICREFAVQAGFQWEGGLAFGGGGMIGGQPLSDEKRQGPPVQHVTEALELTAAALAEGKPVPAEAMKLIEKNRIYAALFNRIYLWMASKSFEKLGEKNGVSKEQLRAQPFAA